MSDTPPLMKLNDRDRSVVERIIAPAAPQEKRGLILNEGYRFTSFGETGSGKTSLQRLVHYYTIAKGYSNASFIHDTKGILPEYPRSIQVRNVREFQTRGFRPNDVPVVSFRGDPRLDISCPPEEVAAFVKGLGQRGQTLPNGQWGAWSVILGIEEMAEMMSPGRKNVKAPSALWALEQGRKVGVSFIGTTQRPVKCAPDVLAQSSASAYFRLTGTDANYLAETMDLEGRLVDTLRGTGNAGLPNYQFCLLVKGEPWDGEIYSLDKKTVLLFE